MRQVILTLLIIFLVQRSFPALSEELPLLPTSLPLPSGNVPKKVEVALAVDEPHVFVSTEGTFELLNQNGTNVFLKGLGHFEAQMSPKENGIAVNGTVYSTDQLLLKTSQGLLKVGKRQYKDQIRVLKNSHSSLTVTNRLDLEEYLKGVLPLEVNPKWPIESLKAQAVVSRTYTLFKSLEKQNEEFSLRDTVESQVYGGALFHHEATDRAINETRGEILTFKGNIFPTYFHSTCGGRTTKPERIWRVHPNPVFKEVSCTFCKDTKHWKWSFHMPLTDIEKIMQKNGYPAKNLKRIRFSEYDSSGRVSKVILEYKRSKLPLTGINFRSFLGVDRLKSLKAWVEVKGNKAQFHGFGWGHGVGFCQWGTKGQADVGKTYLEILKFYFPEAEVTKV